jgi:hypothetical protein
LFFISCLRERNLFFIAQSPKLRESANIYWMNLNEYLFEVISDINGGQWVGGGWIFHICISSSKQFFR